MSVKLIVVFLDTINLQCPDANIEFLYIPNLLIAKNRSNFAFSDSNLHNQYCHDNFKYILFSFLFYTHILQSLHRNTKHIYETQNLNKDTDKTRGQNKQNVVTQTFEKNCIYKMDIMFMGSFNVYVDKRR